MNPMDLRKFFTPKAIAIIGASTDITTINGKPLHYLTKHGYEGKLYPVNPKYKEIAGHTCYPSVKDIPDEVDLAVIAVNYKLVPTMLEQCVEKGVHFATIFSSGFAEAGEEGREMQKQLAELAERTGLRICGPNCQGGVDLYHHTSAAFSAALDTKPFLSGPVGFVTQSGALGFSIFNLAQESGVGFSYVVSTGNEVDLDCVDYMNFMLDDENTRMVFAYIEGIRNGDKFIGLADRALEMGKPLAVLKVGRSEVGSRAASSHTAALTGSDEVFDAFFRQKGIIRVEDIEEFVGLAKVVGSTSVIPKGKGLGVVSISGGGGVLCADTAEACGLEMVELQKETSDIITENIPPFGSPFNPVDITAQAINTAEGFSNVIQAMLADPGVDALVVVITMIVGEPGMRMARDLARISAETDKPIVVAWTAGAKLMREQFELLNQANVPLYQSPVRAVEALAKLMNYGTVSYRKKEEAAANEGKKTEVREVPDSALKVMEGAERVLTERQSKALLKSFGISTSREELARTIDEAVAAGKKIRYPVAMKIDSPDIMHKTEAQAIRLNVQDESELVEAFQEILDNARNYAPEARINGVLIQEMVPDGVEVIVGVNRDPQFGPVVMFGLGGIFVEILKDVSLRVAPVDRQEALSMIEEIRGYGVLAGARGRTKADIGALAETLAKVSNMALAMGPQLEELDINPLIVLPEGQGVKVADALAILQKTENL
jgi:acetyltransferase